MRLDIIIPTYNRAELLKECLDAVLRSESQADWRVSVVDNNSSDNTKEVVESFSLSGRVRYLFARKQGRSAALNHGIASSDCDVIGVIDDDEQIHRDWIDTAVRWLAKSEIDFVGGPYLGLWRTTKPDWVPRGYEGVISADEESEIPKAPVPFSGSTLFLRGGNAVIRRSAFERIGGYREDLGRTGNDMSSCEDQDLFERLQTANLNGYYVPTLIIYHVVSPMRMTRSYYRRWAWGQAKSLAFLDRKARQNVAYVGRIPRYLIGNAIRDAPGFLSRRAAVRFAAELRWWTLCGFASGAYLQKA